MLEILELKMLRVALIPVIQPTQGFLNEPWRRAAPAPSASLARVGLAGRKTSGVAVKDLFHSMSNSSVPGSWNSRFARRPRDPTCEDTGPPMCTLADTDQRLRALQGS